MQVIFYDNLSDKRYLTKNLQNPLSLDLKLKDVEPYKNMSFELSKGTGVASKNYCYIPDIATYYYVETKDYNNGFLGVSCDIDVRMTFGAQIRGLTGTIKRSENIYNGYLMDGNFAAYAYEEIVCKRFPNEMTADRLILMTIGASVVNSERG